MCLLLFKSPLDRGLRHSATKRKEARLSLPVLRTPTPTAPYRPTREKRRKTHALATRELPYRPNQGKEEG